ncbi:hypothetical protein CSA57_14375 [candidate division KSB3 bacterium]|nr:MAG: hypothetical protein CSA57_14375 [candidate division KSB3 bacterium]
MFLARIFSVKIPAKKTKKFLARLSDAEMVDDAMIFVVFFGYIAPRTDKKGCTRTHESGHIWGVRPC